MLLNIVLKQISNLLIIALRLALHWQFHAGFAEGASSCERLEEPCALGNICCVGMMGGYEKGFTDLEECSYFCKGTVSSSL